MSKTELNQIRTAIVAAMEKKGWSAEDLYKNAEVGRLVVYRFLSGANETTSDKLEKIFRALGLKVKK